MYDTLCERGQVWDHWHVTGQLCVAPSEQDYDMEQMPSKWLTMLGPLFRHLIQHAECQLNSLVVHRLMNVPALQNECMIQERLQTWRPFWALGPNLWLVQVHQQGVQVEGLW